MNDESQKLLQLRKLKKYFSVGKHKELKAVQDVSFVINQGEKFGVVGESGCGKSTLGRTILQLYPQTSGSCVYYGKTISDIQPQYLHKEISKLPDYQKAAAEYYQKSLQLDKKIEEINSKLAQLEADSSKKDKKEVEKLRADAEKLKLESKECRKNASRQLREGSRTVGSLILCKDIDKVQELFFKSEDEMKISHHAYLEYWKLHDQYVSNIVTIDQMDHCSEQIAELQKKESLSEIETYRLADLIHTQKKIKNADRASLEAQNAELSKKIDEQKEIERIHQEKDKAFRLQAFDLYHGKDILPITERTQDPKYQAKLDRNYETGINLNKLTKKELREIRPDLQMVFQDPSASLDPRETIGKAIEEVFQINTKMPENLRHEKTLELLQQVDLKPEHYYSYPNSLSGGMKQRAGIARAIALNPKFVILDEAVSALDVSVQAQILLLLNKLQEQKHLTYMFITHDLGVVKHFCDRVLVMYLGNVCELATSEELFHKPLHPYTQSLLAAVPRLTLQKDRKDEEILQGEVPSPIDPPHGCPFHTRCPKCMKICSVEKPEYIEYSPGHFIACHLYRQNSKNDEEEA